MKENSTGEITRLLLDWSGGDKAALDALFPLVYEQLRAMAKRHLRSERDAHTLQRTALVHEAFLRMVDQKQVDWQSRTQFYGLASQMMRRILVDHARGRSAAKRGEGVPHINIDVVLNESTDAVDEALSLTEAAEVDFEAIDAALKHLEQMDPQQGRLVELRFFGGLSIKETAEVMDVSPATIKREWAIARAWLQRELTAGENS